MAEQRWSKEETISKLKSGELCNPDGSFNNVLFLKMAYRNDKGAIDLSGADLAGANLSGINLSDSILIKANLIRANLFGAILERINLTRAKLIRANLSETNLTDATLNRADLTRANLLEAILTRANFFRADLFKTILIDAVLDDAKEIASAVRIKEGGRRYPLKVVNGRAANHHREFDFLKGPDGIRPSHLGARERVLQRGQNLLK